MQLTVVFVFVIIGLFLFDSGQCKDSNIQLMNDINVKNNKQVPKSSLPVFHGDEFSNNLHDMKQNEMLYNRMPLAYTNLYCISPEVYRNNYYEEDSIPLSENMHAPIIWSSGQWPYAEQLGSPIAANPFVHPLYPTLPASRISALPPVQSTHFDNVLPWQEFDPRYDIDMSEAEKILLPNDRFRRSSDEDFMAELQHDAMMNNIIPTMPFPFLRASQMPYRLLPPSPMATDPIMAVFPPGPTSDCSIPLLLGCSPKIIRGTLGNNDYAKPYDYQVNFKNQNGWTDEGKQSNNNVMKSHPIKLQ